MNKTIPTLRTGAATATECQLRESFAAPAVEPLQNVLLCSPLEYSDEAQWGMRWVTTGHLMIYIHLSIHAHWTCNFRSASQRLKYQGKHAFTGYKFRVNWRMLGRHRLSPMVGAIVAVQLVMQIPPSSSWVAPSQ